MRQSLSQTTDRPRTPEVPETRNPAAQRTVTTAVVSSAALAAAAMVDQVGSHTLLEHATAVFAGYGKQPSANVLYGLLYTAAGVSAALWLLVRATMRSHRKAALVLAVLIVAITATSSGVLFTASEYGQRIFPPVWGALALLPSAVGTVAVILMVVRSRSRVP